MTLKNECAQEPYMIIELRGSYSSVKLHARLVWQVLFNEYRSNGDLDQMDSLLCDLYTIQAYFEAWQIGARATGFKFVWSYDSSGYTTIEDDEPLDMPILALESERDILVKLDPINCEAKFYRIHTRKNTEEASL